MKTLFNIFILMIVSFNAMAFNCESRTEGPLSDKINELLSLASTITPIEAVRLCKDGFGSSFSVACTGVKNEIDVKAVHSCISGKGSSFAVACVGVKEQKHVLAVRCGIDT